MSPCKSKSGSTSGGEGGGFAEAPQAFLHQTLDDVRFDDSVELMRSFSRIESTDARRKVIALAQRLADEHPEDRA